MTFTRAHALLIITVLALAATACQPDINHLAPPAPHASHSFTLIDASPSALPQESPPASSLAAANAPSLKTAAANLASDIRSHGTLHSIDDYSTDSNNETPATELPVASGELTTEPTTAGSAPAVPPPAPPLAVPPLAPAPAPSHAPSHAPETAAEHGTRVLATIPFSPSQVGFTISFHPSRPGYKGLTFSDRRHIDVYVDAGMSDASLRHAIAHELGHAVDIALITTEDEIAWRAQRSMASTMQWWPASYANDFSTPAGDFAECFASYLVGSASHSHFGGCAGTADLITQILHA